jgi:hypothetical protein
VFHFGGFDFVGGGVAGAFEGAPHVPGGDGAVGAPTFAEFEEFFGLWFVFFAVGDGPAFLHTEVVDGEDVGTAEAENQKHLNSPCADATDGDEAFDEFRVGHFFGLFESGNDAVDGFLREIFHGKNFRAGEAGLAQGWLFQLEHFMRSWNAACGAEGFDARENGGCGFAGDGLMRDGFDESVIGRFGEDFIELKWGGRLDELGKFVVTGAEMTEGGGEVEGERRHDRNRVGQLRGRKKPSRRELEFAEKVYTG